MSWRNIPLVKEALLGAAVVLCLCPQVPAKTQNTPHKWTEAQPAPARAVRPVLRAVTQSVTVALVVAPASRPAAEPVYVAIRGPDGQVRRFPVEGGRAAIRSEAVVLRPGQSVTIQWVAAK